MSRAARSIVLLAALGGVAAGCESTHRPDVVTIGANARRLPAVSLPAGLAPGSVVVADVTGAAAVRPRELQFAADAQLVGLSWTGWGSAVATGHGSVAADDCTPNCATGTQRRYAAVVRLAGVRTCGGLRYYGAARVSANESGRPAPLSSFISAPCGN